MQENKMVCYGFDNFFEKQLENFDLLKDELVVGRITEVHREQYKLITADYENNARLKGSVFYDTSKPTSYPAVGDFVLVKHNTIGDDIIYSVLERKTKFSRIDTFTNEKEEIVATNFDMCVIVTSLNYDFNVKRIERYLTVAWQSGAIPIIVLTKADLCNNIQYYLDELYEVAIGVDIITVSSVTGEGIDELLKLIKPSQTIVFLGSSGVGKSSLVNKIANDEVMKVNSIREDDSKGKHTTTHRQLIILKNGTMIIDTPGMRSLGMWDVSEGLNATFNDIVELTTKCKFKNCSHDTEPNCAIKEALESGKVSIDRWKSFLKLEKETRYAERKEDFNLQLKYKAETKALHKTIKKMNINKK